MENIQYIVLSDFP